MNKFRELKADEIDCRVWTMSEKGCSILLYKDARCDQNILDETVGPMGWMRSHQSIDGRLYCTVSIKDTDTNEWIAKQDVGTESYTEKEKGQASDSFKRACFNWGIGRGLYTAPFIWVSAQKGDVTLTDKVGRKTTYDKFEVEQIIYDDGKIVALSIKNKSLGKRVFSMDLRKKVD